MAVKDFKNYLKQVEEQYREMQETALDMTNYFKEGRIEQDVLEGCLNQVRTIKANYLRLAYVDYLLNIPNRDKKVAKYHRANKKKYKELMSKMATDTQVIEENKKAEEELLAKLPKEKSYEELNKELIEASDNE